MGRLEGRVAIVTGAGSGNGLAIARAFANEGAAVVIGEYSAQRGAAAAESIQASGEALFVETDVRRWAEVDHLVAETLARFGRLDIMVNNAGVLDGYATCLETSPELFDEVLAINLRGTFFGCKRALAEMVPAGYGKIVNIASVAGLVAEGGGLAYTSSKHAVVGLLRQLEGKVDDLEQQRADPDRRTDSIQKLHDFAVAVEARTDALDRVKPGQRSLHGRVDCFTGRVGDHLHVNVGVHRDADERVLEARAECHLHLRRMSRWPGPGRPHHGMPSSCRSHG